MENLAQLASAFLHCQSGGAIFQCLELIVENGITHTQKKAESGHYITLVYMLHLAGIQMDAECLEDIEIVKLDRI